MQNFLLMREIWNVTIWLTTKRMFKTMKQLEMYKQARKSIRKFA